ncbi:alpha/beta family hydrolase [Bacillus marinisedimentorum]|uniref:alpha/beta family hydrolase n=1 Tax=Bacillus marinisedimentorum TaxID=1821260 RepID=UPI0007E056E9|nr:hypothetical protein [Bacillus marinisedimentorum]
MEITYGQVKGIRNQIIPYTSIQTGESNNRLCVMLPGLGYTTDHPLFYYVTSLFLNKKYDILHLNYKYDLDSFVQLERSEQIRFVQETVKTALDQLLDSETNQKVFLIAKSIGTAALVSELQTRSEIQNAKAVWLTPLLKEDLVFNYLSAHKQQGGLLVIGDRDPHYSKERYNRVSEVQELKTVLVPEANHSLDHSNDPYKSIDVLRDVIQAIDRFSYDDEEL